MNCARGWKMKSGDLLFVLVNIARYLSLDPESALKKTNRKFTPALSVHGGAIA